MVMEIESGPTDNARVALLLDWENIGSVDNVRIDDLLEEVKAHGKVVIARAYANFGERNIREAEALYRAGIEPIYVFASPFGKNSTDMRIAADCIEFCQLHSDIETYVIGTGDGDFIHLLNVLKRCGKKVVIAHRSSSSSSGRLVASADAVIYLADNYQQDSINYITRSASEGELAKRHTLYEEIRDIVESQGEAIILSALQQELAHRVPKFTHKNYGFSKFKDLVVDCCLDQTHTIEIVTKDMIDWVRPIQSLQTARKESPSDDFINSLIVYCNIIEGEKSNYDKIELERGVKKQEWASGISNSVRKRWINALINDEEGYNLFISDSQKEYYSDFYSEVRSAPLFRLNSDCARVKSILDQRTI